MGKIQEHTTQNSDLYAVITLTAAVLTLLEVFGVSISADQQAAILGVVAAAGGAVGVLVRRLRARKS